MYTTFFTALKDRFTLPARQRWADLGCGSGTFTRALAAILPRESKIIAIDKTRQSLAPLMANEVKVSFLQADMEQDRLPLHHLNGILMANSLHYIRDKSAFIQKLEPAFAAQKQWLIVEYDTESANQWVPFPLSFENLRLMFTALGYHRVEKINTRSSMYGGTMYAARVTNT